MEKAQDTGDAQAAQTAADLEAKLRDAEARAAAAQAEADRVQAQQQTVSEEAELNEQKLSEVIQQLTAAQQDHDATVKELEDKIADQQDELRRMKSDALRLEDAVSQPGDEGVWRETNDGTIRIENHREYARRADLMAAESRAEDAESKLSANVEEAQRLLSEARDEAAREYEALEVRLSAAQREMSANNADLVQRLQSQLQAQNDRFVEASRQIKELEAAIERSDAAAVKSMVTRAFRADADARVAEEAAKNDASRMQQQLSESDASVKELAEKAQRTEADLKDALDEAAKERDGLELRLRETQRDLSEDRFRNATEKAAAEELARSLQSQLQTQNDRYTDAARRIEDLEEASRRGDAYAVESTVSKAIRAAEATRLAEEAAKKVADDASRMQQQLSELAEKAQRTEADLGIAHRLLTAARDDAARERDELERRLLDAQDESERDNVQSADEKAELEAKLQAQTDLYVEASTKIQDLEEAIRLGREEGGRAVSELESKVQETQERADADAARSAARIEELGEELRTKETSFKEAESTATRRIAELMDEVADGALQDAVLGVIADDLKEQQLDAKTEEHRQATASWEAKRSELEASVDAGRAAIVQAQKDSGEKELAAANEMKWLKAELAKSHADFKAAELQAAASVKGAQKLLQDARDLAESESATLRGKLEEAVRERDSDRTLNSDEKTRIEAVVAELRAEVSHKDALNSSANERIREFERSIAEKDASAEQSSREVAELKSSQERADAKIANVQQELAAVSSSAEQERAASAAMIESLVEQQRAREARVAEAEAAASQRNTLLMDEAKVLNERVHGLEEEAANGGLERVDLRTEVDSLRKELAAKESERTTAARLWDDERSRLEAAVETGRVTIDRANEDMRTQVAKAADAVASLRTELAQARADNETVLAEMSTAKDALDRRAADIEVLQSRLGTASEETLAERQAREDLEKQIGEARAASAAAAGVAADEARDLMASLDVLRKQKVEADLLREQEDAAARTQIETLETELTDLTTGDLELQKRLDEAVEAKRLSDVAHLEADMKHAVELQSAAAALSSAIAEAAAGAEASKLASGEMLATYDAVVRALEAKVEEDGRRADELRSRLAQGDGLAEQLTLDLQATEAALADTASKLEDQRRSYADATEAHAQAVRTINDMAAAHASQLAAKDEDIRVQERRERRAREEVVSKLTRDLGKVKAAAERKLKAAGDKLRVARAKVVETRGDGDEEVKGLQEHLDVTKAELLAVTDESRRAVADLTARLASEELSAKEREAGWSGQVDEQSSAVAGLREDVERKEQALKAAARGSDDAQALLVQRDAALTSLRAMLWRSAALSEANISRLQGDVAKAKDAGDQALRDAEQRLKESKELDGVRLLQANAEHDLAILNAAQVERELRQSLAQLTQEHSDKLTTLQEVAETVNTSLADVTAERERLTLELQRAKAGEVEATAQGLQELTRREEELAKRHEEQLDVVREAANEAKAEADKQLSDLRQRAAAAKKASDEEKQRLLGELEGARSDLEARNTGSSAEADLLRAKVKQAQHQADTHRDTAAILRSQIDADFETATDNAKKLNARILELDAKDRRQRTDIVQLTASLDKQTAVGAALQDELNKAKQDVSEAEVTTAQLSKELLAAQAAAEAAHAELERAKRASADALAAARSDASAAATAAANAAGVVLNAAREELSSKTEALEASERDLSLQLETLTETQQALETLQTAKNAVDALEAQCRSNVASLEARVKEFEAATASTEATEAAFSALLNGAAVRLRDFEKEFAEACDPAKALNPTDALSVAEKAEGCAERVRSFSRLGGVPDLPGIDASHTQRWTAARLIEEKTLNDRRDGVLRFAVKAVIDGIQKGLDDETHDISQLRSLDGKWKRLVELLVSFTAIRLADR
jgi:chromosome segregation ATPase